MDELAQQKLYEKWLKKDLWRLHGEAAPLLLGMDPESAECSAALDDLRQQLENAVQGGGLAVETADAAPEAWSAGPAAVYRWALAAGVAVPEPMRALMEFILQTVTAQDSMPVEEGTDAFHAGNEAILGAALSVLAAFPAECFHDNGGIDLRKVIILMHEHAPELFGTKGLEYSYERVFDLLEGRIKKLVNSE